MSRDNHGAGPCIHCGGSGKCWDARIGDVDCYECDGCGHFDDNGEPVIASADINGAAREARVEPSELQKAGTAHATSPVPSEINKTALPRWIPVSERLPANDVWVLTHPGWAAGRRGVSLDQWNDYLKGFLMCAEDGHVVTHWMPLPLPPGESAGEVPSNEKASAVGSPVSAVAEAEALQVLRRLAFSKDLYELLLNMQNGIVSMADSSMANKVIQQIDRARSLVGALQGVKENKNG